MRSLHSVAVICLCWAVGASVPPSVQAQTAAAFQQARQRMVDEDVAGAGVKNERVLRSMRETPRHEFVPLPHRKNAYFDMALPIGEGQTISSPFIVAYMTEALDPQPTDRVLEIGTGSGYQAAVLSPLVAEVYTIEIVPQLGQNAARTLKRLGYRNVFTRIGDGFLGWPEHAPFDKIIVTCSPEDVPQPLVDQLKEGGRMVIPVGQRYQQTLYVLKKSQGSLQREALQPTLFVPMTGAAEAKRQVQPDPASPSLVNGNFEESFGDPPMPAGWYYLRQARLALLGDLPDRRRSRSIRGQLFQQQRQLVVGARTLVGIKAGGVMEAQPLLTAAQLPLALPGYRVQFQDGRVTVHHQGGAVVGQLFIPVEQLVGMAIALEQFLEQGVALG